MSATTALTLTDPAGAQASAVAWLIVLRVLACHVTRIAFHPRKVTPPPAASYLQVEQRAAERPAHRPSQETR